MTLLELCIDSIANLLQHNYWPIGAHGFDEHNPFAALPSELIEKLVYAAVHNAPTGLLSVNDIYPLLMSGRIRNFELEGLLVKSEELVCILTTLSIHGFYLNTLVLDEIQFRTSRYSCGNPQSPSVSSSIESLLALSPNLEKLRIGLAFDIKALQNIESLKQIVFNFEPSNKLFDIIPKFDDFSYLPNNTLTHLTIKPEHVIPAEEVAFILQYCTELTYMENNIAGGLELLHTPELSDGTLQKQYKLQRIVLGDMFAQDAGVASLSAVHIASVTCPLVKSLDILVNDHRVLASIRYFINLETLLIQWEYVAAPGNFTLSIQLVLEEIGLNLKKLSIIDFSNINFEAISRCCPNLEYFKIDYHSTENSSSRIACYQNLEKLYLECMNEEGATKLTLLQLLSSCQNLSCVSLENILSLDNETLNEILTLNNLAQLSEAHFVNCSVGIEGLKSLVESCKALKFLRFSSINIEFEETVDVVHEINPFVVMMLMD